MNLNIDVVKKFLIEAKKATYAAQGDDATVTPLLNGSKQLEFRSGDFYIEIFIGECPISLDKK